MKKKPAKAAKRSEKRPASPKTASRAARGIEIRTKKPPEAPSQQFPLILRPARVSDAKLLCEAERSTAATPGSLVSRPHELLPENFTRMIAKLSTHRRGRYLVAERDGDLAGHAFLDPMEMEALAHIARLTVVVHPGFQGQGVGRALILSLIDWARQTPGIEKIELLVRAVNGRAVKLYQGLGFVEEGRMRARVRTPGGIYIDDIMMGLFVKELR